MSDIFGQSRSLIIVWAASAACFGCTGESGESGESNDSAKGASAGSKADDDSEDDSGEGPDEDGDAGVGASSAAGSNSGAGSGSGAGATSGSGETDDECEEYLARPSEAPIRRLSHDEYLNTVRQLFPEIRFPDDLSIVEDSELGDFRNAAENQSSSAFSVERFMVAAEKLSVAASEGLESWAPCNEESAECAAEIALSLAPLTYRRPLLKDEEEAIAQFVEDAFSEQGFENTVRMSIQFLLESPYFLYRPEFGMPDDEEADGENSPLSAFELASRLSFFMWGTMPDETLWQEALDGTLLTGEGYRNAAIRLMEDEKAESVLLAFFDEWLGLSEIYEVSLDGEMFPEFTSEVQRDLAQSSLMYARHAFWKDDSVESLYAGNYGFVNDRLAPLFGVEAPGSEELVKVELPEGERSGIMTQPGLLAATSHGITHSPIFRGVTLLRRVLCQAPPAPPDGVIGLMDDLGEVTDEVCTTREYFTQVHQSNITCVTCHEAIDGAGYVFENYDAIGRFRTEENDCPVDASGAFPTSDIGELTGAVELSQRLVESEDAKECLSEQWFHFALARRASSEEACFIRSMANSLEDTDGSLQGLVLALVDSPLFKTRPAIQVGK